MNKPVCSIIIPTRDCLAYLPTTLATVDLQGRCDLEVILVDDGSSDGTAHWARNRAPSRFSLKVLETGGVGPASARNLGVEAASGQFIAFLDADDVWWPGKLDRQLAYHAEHPETALSFTDYIHVLPDGCTRGTCFEYWRCNWTQALGGAYVELRGAEAKLLGTNLIGTSTVLVGRDHFMRVGGFQKTWPSAEDWDLWLRLAAQGPVACSGAVTMSYLMRPGSETANRGRRVEALRAIISRYEARGEKDMIEAVSQARARIAVGDAEMARAAGNPSAAAVAHMRAMMADPNWRTGRALAADVVSALTSLRTETRVP